MSINLKYAYSFEMVYLTSCFLGGFPLQRRRTDRLADTVGHLLHVITQVGGNLADFEAMEAWRRLHPVNQAARRAADAVAENAGHRNCEAATSALQQLPVLFGQRAQPLLIRGRKGGRWPLRIQAFHPGHGFF